MTSDTITVKQLLRLLKKYNKQSEGRLNSIVIYEDGSGGLLDVDDREIFYFDNADELVNKLTLPQS